MLSRKHKLKINNSYESEPSSGSGSSLGEQQECPVSDDENIHFPYLMKPIGITTDATARAQNKRQHDDASMAYTDSSYTEDESERANDAKMERLMKYGRPANSSQESPFEGFNESPFGSLRQKMYNNESLRNIKLPPHANTEDPSPGKLAFPRYYDTIVEENSCNAVDIKISNQPVISRHGSTSMESNINDINPSDELSFNGKIPSQNKTNEICKQAESLSKGTCSNLDTSINSSQLNESFILRKYSNERSPDLFGDDEDEGDNVEDCPAAANDANVELNACPEQQAGIEEAKEDALDESVNRSFNCATESCIGEEQTFDYSTTQMTATDDPATLFRKNCRRERELLRRIRQCLAGVPPPPSLTIPQLDMFSTVLAKKQEILTFFHGYSSEDKSSSSADCVIKSIFKPSHSEEEAREMGWREVLGVRQLGLSYNLNKASEHNEYLSLAVIERFIGAETASSHRYALSSAKKRNCRLNKLLTQSPGNRLSHLAKRRAIFSSANLATTSLKTNTSLGPQILIDKKKAKHRRKATPKRATPGSKRKTRKTPSSSARKRLFRNDLVKPGPSRETSKRALFQSPAKQQPKQKTAPPKPVIKPEIANRVEKSKRALFPPETASDSSTSMPPKMQYATVITPHMESLLKRKRSCVEEEDELSTQSSKLFRSSSANLTPRALKIHSQSLVQSSSTSNNFANALGGKVLQRAYSDMSAPANNLTENQRKKLLWAVSQALQEKKITAKHESFKQFASILARVVRRIFTEYYQKSSTSNSETMLRLAKKYAFHVISGKNLDDIYLQAKSQIDESKRQSNVRLSGYIAPAEFEQRRQLSQQMLQQTQSSSSSQYGGSLQNLFATENSIDSFSMSISQTSSVFCGSGMSNSVKISQSQASFEERISEDMVNTQNALSKITANATQQNSSSKSNLGVLALRENIDGEQRRSVQKNFTGKDQRNISPYPTGAWMGSGRKIQSEIVQSEIPHITAKVKRQITFDS